MMHEQHPEISLLRTHLYSDDISESKNRLWVFKQKLNSNETFNDFGYLVSIRLSDYEGIVKEYYENVGNRLLQQVSNYVIGYLNEHQIKFDIVRYHQDNFLLFIYELSEEEIQQIFVNMQTGMANYTFKHRNKMFRLRFYFAIMQYIKNESFSSVLDQLDEKLFLHAASLE